LLGKNRSKAFFPIVHSFRGKLKATQQEEFGNIAEAQLVAQPTQQYLKDNIGGYLDEVEGGTRPFVEGATTILTAHKKLARQRLGAVAVYRVGSPAFKLSTQF
jgi:hypothetical protein